MECLDVLEGDDESCPLENSHRRAFLWSMTSFAFLKFGKFCHMLGSHNAMARFAHWAGSKTKQRQLAIAGVNVLISGNVKQGEKSGIIIYIHGGGFVIGSMSVHGDLADKVAVDANAVVISIDYRLAPKHKFPSGLDDCVAVTKAVLNLSDEIPEDLRLCINPRRVIIMGDSAGGNLTLTTALDLAREGDHRLVAIIPICPWLQAVTMFYDSYHKHCYLNRMLAWFLPNYAGISDPPKDLANAVELDQHLPTESRKALLPFLAPSEQFRKIAEALAVSNENFRSNSALNDVVQLATNPRAWPLLASDSDLAKLPPTFLQLCSRDPFRDEGLAFAERIRKIGATNFQLNMVPFAQHCESMMALGSVMNTKAAQKGYADVIKFINNKFHDL